MDESGIVEDSVVHDRQSKLFAHVLGKAGQLGPAAGDEQPLYLLGGGAFGLLRLEVVERAPNFPDEVVEVRLDHAKRGIFLRPALLEQLSNVELRLAFL